MPDPRLIHDNNSARPQRAAKLEAAARITDLQVRRARVNMFAAAASAPPARSPGSFDSE